jgi:hypothetical protein
VPCLFQWGFCTEGSKDSATIGPSSSTEDNTLLPQKLRKENIPLVTPIFLQGSHSLTDSLLEMCLLDWH